MSIHLFKLVCEGGSFTSSFIVASFPTVEMLLLGSENLRTSVYITCVSNIVQAVYVSCFASGLVDAQIWVVSSGL